MIHSVRPTVSPLFLLCIVLLDFEKWGRTDGDMCKTYDLCVTVGWPSGSNRAFKIISFHYSLP